jgi:hypothetical protein
MSGVYMRGSTRGTIDRESNYGASGAINILSLAAAPTFAGMAFLTGAFGGGHAEVLCSGPHGASSLSGMVLMYALMSAFHLAPWLKQFSGRHVTRRWNARHARWALIRHAENPANSTWRRPTSSAPN